MFVDVIASNLCDCVKNSGCMVTWVIPFDAKCFTRSFLILMYTWKRRYFISYDNFEVFTDLLTSGHWNIICTVEITLSVVSCQTWKSWTFTMSGNCFSKSIFNDSISIEPGIVWRRIKQLSFTIKKLSLTIICEIGVKSYDLNNICCMAFDTIFSKTYILVCRYFCSNLHSFFLYKTMTFFHEYLL